MELFCDPAVCHHRPLTNQAGYGNFLLLSFWHFLQITSLKAPYSKPQLNNSFGLLLIRHPSNTCFFASGFPDAIQKNITKRIGVKEPSPPLFSGSLF